MTYPRSQRLKVLIRIPILEQPSMQVLFDRMKGLGSMDSFSSFRVQACAQHVNLVPKQRCLSFSRAILDDQATYICVLIVQLWRHQAWTSTANSLAGALHPTASTQQKTRCGCLHKCVRLRCMGSCECIVGHMGRCGCECMRGHMGGCGCECMGGRMSRSKLACCILCVHVWHL